VIRLIAEHACSLRSVLRREPAWGRADRSL